MENKETNITETSVTEGLVEETKTYTQEEVDALLQSETDRRVTAALKKQERKNEEKVKEAEKLAAMSEAEKYQYQLEQREKAIAEKEKQLALSENKNAAARVLADNGLSVALADFVIAEDAETMKLNIDTLTKAFKASVAAEVEKRIGGNSGKQNSVDTGALTKEKFSKLPLHEQQELINNNPELKAILFAS